MAKCKRCKKRDVLKGLCVCDICVDKNKKNKPAPVVVIGKDYKESFGAIGSEWETGIADHTNHFN